MCFFLCCLCHSFIFYVSTARVFSISPFTILYVNLQDLNHSTEGLASHSGVTQLMEIESCDVSIISFVSRLSIFNSANHSLKFILQTGYFCLIHFLALFLLIFAYIGFRLLMGSGTATFRP